VFGSVVVLPPSSVAQPTMTRHGISTSMTKCRMLFSVRRCVSFLVGGTVGSSSGGRPTGRQSGGGPRGPPDAGSYATAKSTSWQGGVPRRHVIPNQAKTPRNRTLLAGGVTETTPLERGIQMRTGVGRSPRGRGPRKYLLPGGQSLIKQQATREPKTGLWVLGGARQAPANHPWYDLSLVW